MIDSRLIESEGPVEADENLKRLLAIIDLKLEISSLIDNLTTNDGTKVLSAKQGKVLKDAIDAIPLKSAAIMPLQANSTATEVAGLVTDFNLLIAKLKTVGLMATE